MKKSQQSANGPVGEYGPAGESTNRVIIEHPDADQINPEMFRLDQSELDQPTVKKIQPIIPIKMRPEPLEFVRVDPRPEYSMAPICFVALKQSREYYLVDPRIKSELRLREYFIGQLFVGIDRYDKIFLWLAKTQSPTGQISDWYISMLECIDIAKREWVQIVPDLQAGVYTAAPAEERLEDPHLPEESFQELFRRAVKRRIVNSLDHPVFKQLRGRA